ncbi:MAG: 50S ribosomal protein L19 [bacterium]|nr:50S ribosomal protein L19 [bacterium]
MINQETMARIKPGARVRVWERIKEKTKERQGTFEGLVLARKHGKEMGATFTVRSVVDDVGVEKVYPFNSPNVVKVEILSSPKKIHRAKLYYLRTLSNKKVREKMKKIGK